MFITNSEETSNVDTKIEQAEISDLQSELLIRSQELEKVKSEKKELIAKYSQRKVSFGKIERQLSGDIEVLAISRSELLKKVTELELELKHKSLEMERIKYEKETLNTDYKDDQKGYYTDLNMWLYTLYNYAYVHNYIMCMQIV